MGNLTGANFRGWVKKQIDIREQKLALQNKDNETLVWSNNKTAWLRMISSVNVSPEKSKELTGNEFYAGRELAKNYVLFGGTVKNDFEKPVLKQGVVNLPSDSTSDISSTSRFAYGFNNERGLSPMPGLTSASVKALNRGALKKAEIKFTAHTREQFKILDALYMRVGYTILLEWGHTMYFDNEGILQHASYNTKPFEIFRTGEYKQKTNGSAGSAGSSGEAGSSDQGAQQVVLREIDKHREITDGNYDGFFGKITNFNWSLNADGTYDISISAISIGDIIESLNINKPLSPDEDAKLKRTKANGEKVEDDTPLIIARRDKSKLDNWLYLRYNEISNLDNARSVSTNNQDKNLKVKISWRDLSSEDVKRATLAIFPKSGEANSYIKLGYLLKYINENLLLVDGDNKNYFSIDYDFESNLCTTHPFQLSADPNICVIPFHVPHLQGKRSEFIKRDIYQIFDKVTLLGFRGTDSDYVGKLMHIHVNIEYITSLIDQSANQKTGELHLKTFLTSLMNGIQGALGGLNKFTVSYNNEENRLKIYDDVPLDPKVTKTNEGESSSFRVFGVKPGIEGSFVTNVSLNATISSEFATMVSIGAQANSTSDITNATALSKLNQGLTDFITPVKKSRSSDNKPETPESKLSRTYYKLRKRNGFIFKYYYRGASVSAIIDQAMALNSQFNTFFTTYLSSQNNVPSTQGFIPFDLGLEMEGISGPRIYEKFNITGDILPSSYPQSLAFLIKGLDHTIDQKGWSTTIDSLSYEAPKVVATPIAETPSGVPSSPDEGDSDPPPPGDPYYTLTSGYEIRNGANGPFFFAGKKADKYQITIHYTAGGPYPAGTVRWWNKAHDEGGDLANLHISTHYVLGGDGFIERLFPLETYGNHTGVGGNRKQRFNVGIEINNRGFGSPNLWGLDRNDPSTYATLVDKNGRIIPTWRDKRYYQPINSAQIKSLKKIILEISAAYPDIPLDFDYDVLFPEEGVPSYQLDLRPGLYTHNSFKSSKRDVPPQKELIDMLKTLT